jgi:hypothetical protein
MNNKKNKTIGDLSSIGKIRKDKYAILILLRFKRGNKMLKKKLISIISILGSLFILDCVPEKENKKVKNLIPLLLENKSSQVRSESNFEESVFGVRKPLLGTGFILDKNSLENPNHEFLKTNLETNIRDGQINTEVNEPLILIVSNLLDTSSTSITNSFFVTHEGEVLFSRIILSSNKIILIPQIRLQPTKTYYAVIGGIKDNSGRDLGNYRIKFTNRDLDYGLYWYGKFGICEKYFPGVENLFYSNHKKTVLFAHGWQANSVTGTDVYGRKGFRYEMFYWEEDNFGGSKNYNGLKEFTNHSWIDKGWNTGIVYWNQFADEPTFSEGNFLGVYAAEAKIWNLFNRPNGSRYRTLDSNGNDIFKFWDGKLVFKNQNIQISSVGELLSLYVVDCLQTNIAGNIRLTGHSLGNQMITFISDKVNQANIKINRITLLDPAWTDGAKNYLPRITQADASVKLIHNQVHAISSNSIGRNFWLTEYTRMILFKIMNSQWQNGIVVERFNSTILNLYLPIMDENAELSKQISVTDLRPWFYGATQLGDKHIVIRHHYFWSMQSAPPIECRILFFNRIKTGDIAISASTPDSRVRETMLNGIYFDQVEGRYSPNSSDDWFEQKRKL